MKPTSKAALRRAVLLGGAVFAASAWSSSALADSTISGIGGVENIGGIVPRDDLNPNAFPPGGVLDPENVNGIGQIIIDTGGGTIGSCTGSLINPRTVLFAAHCVNNVDASAYGANSGGIGAGVFFQNFTLPGIIDWLFPGPSQFQSNPDAAYFNVNQVWYDPRSLEDAAGGGFLEADIALATLDTRAEGIPTWTLLFSPLTEQTHVTFSGYGQTGNGITAPVSGGFRRRVVENVLSVLGSLDDRNDAIFGPAAPFLPQTLYQSDFDSPDGFDELVIGDLDFDVFPGAALPREGITAPGDSGGPLIVDEKYDRDVVAGVLSGGSRFFGTAQPFSTYGTTNFYQPLFLFWDVIVQNNPYRYVSAKAGDGEWFDPNHWVQDMDPNYVVDRGGVLVNYLPDTPALGVSGDTTKFGVICNLTDCTDIGPESTGVPVGDGVGLVIPDGPGSSGFVPNNIEPDRLAGVQARYYDVTLNQKGTTSLSGAATVDIMQLAGEAKLNVREDGALTVLSDYTQWAGWTNVDGLLDTGEALLLTGLLSGSGTFRAPFLTLGAVGVAPGGAGDVGTLTVQGNLVLSSGTALFLDVDRGGVDRIDVLADPTLAGSGAALLGGTLVFDKGPGAAPRHGETYAFLTAEGGIEGTFDQTFVTQGVLKPEITYTETEAIVALRAGRFKDVLNPADGPTAIALADALDTLREGSYANLAGLYGELDWVNVSQLAATFDRLAPNSLFDVVGLASLQSDAFTLTFADRLSMLGSPSGAPAGVSFMGSPGQAFALAGQQGMPSGLGLNLRRSGAAPLAGGLPNGVRAFVSGGYGESRVSAASGRAALSNEDGARAWDVSVGLEKDVTPRFTMGVATFFSEGQSRATQNGFAESNGQLAQSAVYGAYRFDGGAYVSGLAAAGALQSDAQRNVSLLTAGVDLAGELSGSVVNGMLETGYALQPLEGFTVTPKASLRYAALRTGAWEELGGNAALAIDARTAERMEARFGFAAQGAFATLSGWSIAPRIDAAFVQNLSGDEAGYLARFAAARDFAFVLPGAERDTNWVDVGGGLFLSNGLTSFGLQMQSSAMRQELHEDRVLATFNLRF